MMSYEHACGHLSVHRDFCCQCTDDELIALRTDLHTLFDELTERRADAWVALTTNARGGSDQDLWRRRVDWYDHALSIVRPLLEYETSTVNHTKNVQVEDDAECQFVSLSVCCAKAWYEGHGTGLLDAESVDHGGPVTPNPYLGGVS